MIINLPNILYSVTFDASERKVTLHGLGRVYQFELKTIYNLNSSIIIYSWDITDKLANSIMKSGDDIIVNLKYDTTAMSDNDSIVVTIDGNPKSFTYDALIRQIAIQQ